MTKAFVKTVKHHPISFKGKSAFCEDIAIESLANKYGTPLYVYSYATIMNRCQEFRSAFSKTNNLLCYAIKANSNGSILRIIKNAGFGFDVVSGGELLKALKTPANPKNIVFSGVGKSFDEITLGLKKRILQFNIESLAELKLIGEIATSLRLKTQISLRLNPNIDSKTNPAIATGKDDTKFGVPPRELKDALNYLKNHRFLSLTGLSCHVGSQLTSLEPIDQAAKFLSGRFADIRASGFALKIINLGGGLGVRYIDECPPSIGDYAKTIIKHISPLGATLIVEPGRALVGESGFIITRALFGKHSGKKHFLIVDAGMTELIRPALYGAAHSIIAASNGPLRQTVDIVGPVCETSDVLAKNVRVPDVKSGDLFCVLSAGAYGAAMSSNYNCRPKPPEVLIDGKKAILIRRRQTTRDMWREETGNIN